MPALPNYVKLGWKDAVERPGTAVERSEMERGVAKQRRVAADVVVQVELTMYLDSPSSLANFETWFYTSISAGADWFDMPLPRGGTVSARFVKGEPGDLVPQLGTWGRTTRRVVIEYVRSAS